MFLSSHGGSSNAYTDTEDTVYFFDVGSDHLSGALDRFAQFFIAPQVSHVVARWNQGRPMPLVVVMDDLETMPQDRALVYTPKRFPFGEMGTLVCCFFVCFFCR